MHWKPRTKTQRQHVLTRSQRSILCQLQRSHARQWPEVNQTQVAVAQREFITCANTGSLDTMILDC